jgi:hypothetical protein
MQRDIDLYFASCFTTQQKVTLALDQDGKTIQTIEEVLVRVKPFTMAGLAFALNMTSMTLRNYGNPNLTNYDERFFATIQRARLIIEEFVESQVTDGKNSNGAQFLLRCNFAYKDTQYQGTVGKDGELVDPTNPSSNDDRAKATRERLLQELHMNDQGVYE